MSKQLLHTYQSDVVIAALNDRAYAIIKDDESSPLVVAELMVANRQEDDRDASKHKTGGGDGDVEKEEGRQSKQKKEKQKRRDREANNPLEIQAVCSTEVDSRFWLAVSREDKTLSLYSIIPSSSAQQKVDKGVEEKNQQKRQRETKILYPTVTYNLPKRARCLAFCSVPSSSSSDASGASNCPVIIAGDLSGDAISFPLQRNNSGASVFAPVATDADAKPATTTTRRLLLGHTASILTGLNVVPATTSWDEISSRHQQKQQLILTADRDEKIRASCFPETHIIHGYLLGHSSFVSAMDAAVVADCQSSGGDEGNPIGGGMPLCITGSGDGTVRLWDYQSCKQVGMVPVVIKKSEEDEKVIREKNLEEKESAIEGEQEGKEFNDFEVDIGDGFSDEEKSFDGHAVAVPLSVALGPNARHVIVARYGIPSIDIHPIPSPPSNSSASSSSTSLLLPQLVSLHKKQTIGCPSQPLAVRCFSDGSVLVLAREPDYLLHFQSSGDSTAFENISSTSPFSMALQGTVKDEIIVMPETTLERDEEGKWKLHKNKVNDPGDHSVSQGELAGDRPKDSGPHWNDAGRKETARLAEQRRRKRRREEAKKKRESCKLQT